MTEKQINKWLRRQYSPIGWVLIGYYALLNLLVSLAMGVDMGKQLLQNLQAGTYPFDFDWDIIWSSGWGHIGACLVLLAVLHGWKGSHYPKNREKKMSLLTVVTVIGIGTCAQLLNSIWITALEGLCNLFGHSMLPLLESVSGSTDSFSMFLYSAVFAPIAEEVLFRGYVLHGLKPYGKRFAILGSALLFGIFHGNLLQTPYAFVMGLVLGWLTVEYSLGWSLFLHVFNNLVLAEGLSRLTQSLPPMAAEGIILAVLAVFSLSALVILIPKRGEIREYRRGEWIDRRCVKCLFTNPGILTLLMMMAANTVQYFFI